jgi:S1-C subfamily serine protease
MARASEPADLISFSKDLRAQIVQIVVPSTGGQSKGSGFWINETGYLATCWHVVASNPDGIIQVQSAVDPLIDLDRNKIISSNWEAWQAKVVSRDETNDLALLKVEGSPFVARRGVPIQIGDQKLTAHYAAAKLNAGLPDPGQKILLAGYPLGLPYPIVQEGIVASVAYDLPNWGQTVKILLSIVANPGNSGGPVMDDKGKVIGVLEGGLPSRPGKDPAQAQAGIAVVVPTHFLSSLIANLKL